jgi:hypothetical protein
VAVLVDDPATARGHIVVARIAGGIEDGVRIDEQGNAGLEMEGSSKKNIPLVGAVEFNRLAAAAVIDRLLNAFGVKATFVLVSEQTVRGGEAGLESGANGRNVWFDDGPPVLREKICGECRGEEKNAHPGEERRSSVWKRSPLRRSF